MGQCFRVKGLWLVVAALGVSGCMTPGGDGNGTVSRFKSNNTSTAVLTARQKEAAESRIISGLQARRSVLKSQGSFDQVAGAVLAANSRAAEAELRSARLRAEAQSKNWLPTLGPQISLTSLSNVVASLIIDQVLFDNGRKKAERDFAKADVEVAAVTLAQDTNDRVFTALSLYLAAEEAREKATLSQATLKDMSKFQWIMQERVRGGVSDMSDLNILNHKIAEIRSTLGSETEAANTAIAELNAMSVRPLSDLRGLSNITVSADAAQPLSVMLSEAEKERAIAKAKIDRAGFLPGLSASATVGDNKSDPALRVTTDQPLGFGTGANLKAIEATKETANRKVAQANEDANRELRRLEQRQIALTRQAGEASGLTSQAKSNLDLFQEQYDVGQRQVMDVVGVYETFARQQQAQVGLKYGAALARLEMAKQLGLLADGSEI